MQVDFENLFKQNLEMTEIWFKEAREIYPSKYLEGDDEKWGEMVAKQGDYVSKKEEEWFRNYQKENNLSDYELGTLRRDLRRAIENKKMVRKVIKTIKVKK